jgi:NADH-quinone oxidoreductase subunit N
MSVFTIEALLAVLGLVVLMLEAFMPRLPARTLGGIALGGAGLALLLFCTVAGGQEALPGFVAAWHKLDSAAWFFKGYALVTTILVLALLLISEGYLRKFIPGGRLGEMAGLPLIACAGMMWMASAVDLVTIFVALELVTVTFYVLVSATRKSPLSLEAGVKYLILGALSTGVLVFGMAWVYGATGSLSLEGIAGAAGDPETNRVALLFGAAFLLSGLAFKVAAAPFQMWVPDVYQGASTPVTTFLSVGSKAAGVLVLARVVESLTGEGSLVRAEVVQALAVAGAATVLLGSLPAIHQTNVKRLLAYSSISHAGFLVLALASRDGSRFDVEPSGVAAFYLAVYLPMTVLGFLGLIVMRLNGRGEELEDFRGLASKSPLFALLMTVTFASLAGLPLTAGFFGKMWVFLAMVDSGLWFALACSVIGAGAGFYYYFRIIYVMYREREGERAIAMPFGARVLGAGLAVAIVVLGVWPRPLQGLLGSTLAETAGARLDGANGSGLVTRD